MRLISLASGSSRPLALDDDERQLLALFRDMSDREAALRAVQEVHRREHEPFVVCVEIEQLRTGARRTFWHTVPHTYVSDEEFASIDDLKVGTLERLDAFLE